MTRTSVVDGIAWNASATLDVLASEGLGNGCDMQSIDSGSDSGPTPVRWRFAHAELDERNHELMVDGATVALEAKPLAVLLCLLRAEGELVTKEELFDTVWAGRVVTDGVLSQAIRRIREVLGDSKKAMLRTVHGYGYRLDVPIEIEGRDDPGTRLQLEAGQSLPNLPHWILEERLQTRPANELWRIRHADSGQLRVVKLALDERAQRALKREVTLNKVLRTERGDSMPLVPLLEWQFETSPAWVQMPWYEHGSLVDWLEAHGGPAKLEMSRRLNIVAEAADALAQAHALGVMHKDIKPGNLLVEQSGPEPRLLLCDFGSGTVKSRDRLEQVGVTVMGFTQTVHADSSTSGTPAYMAPEVLKGGVFSEQSDIYGLGILLYQLVIGNLHEPLAAGWEEDVADPGLRAIIAEACAGKPARRIASMQELAERLRAWTPNQDPVTNVAQSMPSAPRARAPIWAAVAIAISLIFVWFWQARDLHHSAGGSSGLTQFSALATGQRVAILAFELLGLDEQTQTVMAGLQDALIADLANLAGVRLVHGQNLAALGLVDATAERIGRSLKADQLIRGSVQQLGEQLRVNLQIIDAARGETIWGRAVEGTRTNLFAMQAKIAQALAEGLGTSISTSGGSAVSNEAYEAYLAALSLWKQGYGGKEGKLASAIDNALSLDPDFIDANLLALLKASRDYWFSNATRTESEALIAKHLAVLESQDTAPVKLATARAVRRYYLNHDPRGGVEILAPFRRQLVLNSESAMFYAYMLRRIGRAEDAFDVLDEVIDQDPSALTPVEAKAELMAFQGRGGEAVALLREAAERFGEKSHAPVKIASFAYQLTGDVTYLDLGRKALKDDEMYEKMQGNLEMEVARRAKDWETVRELARKRDKKTTMVSGHGRVPVELSTALALYAGQAPRSEVRVLADQALEKMQVWREESDSDSRRSTMAMILALLGRADEAEALLEQVAASFPVERDQIEGAHRLLEASLVQALLGHEEEAIQRLQALSTSTFKSMNLCAVPQEMAHQAIWDIPAAQALITQQCQAIWDRNRREIAAILAEP